MQQIDTAIFFWINRGWNHPLMDALFAIATWLGVGWVQLVIAAGILALARIQIWQEWTTIYRRAWCPLLIAWLTSGLLAQMIKQMWDRPRPSQLEGALVASDELIFWKSFPSGHATTTAAIAMVVALAFSRRCPPVAFGAAVVTVLVMLSRVYRGVHYPSDVVAGALIGIACGYFAYQWWQRRSIVRERSGEQQRDTNFGYRRAGASEY